MNTDEMQKFLQTSQEHDPAEVEELQEGSRWKKHIGSPKGGQRNLRGATKDLADKLPSSGKRTTNPGSGARKVSFRVARDASDLRKDAQSGRRPHITRKFLKGVSKHQTGDSAKLRKISKEKGFKLPESAKAKDLKRLTGVEDVHRKAKRKLAQAKPGTPAFNKHRTQRDKAANIMARRGYKPESIERFLTGFVWEEKPDAVTRARRVNTQAKLARKAGLRKKAYTMGYPPKRVDKASSFTQQVYRTQKSGRTAAQRMWRTSAALRKRAPSLMKKARLEAQKDTEKAFKNFRSMKARKIQGGGSSITHKGKFVAKQMLKAKKAARAKPQDEGAVKRRNKERSKRTQWNSGGADWDRRDAISALDTAGKIRRRVQKGGKDMLWTASKSNARSLIARARKLGKTQRKLPEGITFDDFVVQLAEVGQTKRRNKAKLP